MIRLQKIGWFSNVHPMSFNSVLETMESKRINQNVWCCWKRICTDSKADGGSSTCMGWASMCCGELGVTNNQSQCVVLWDTHMHRWRNKGWFSDMNWMCTNDGTNGGSSTCMGWASIVCGSQWNPKQSMTMCGVVGNAYAPMAEQRMIKWRGSDVHQWRNKGWFSDVYPISFNCMWVMLGHLCLWIQRLYQYNLCFCWHSRSHTCQRHNQMAKYLLEVCQRCAHQFLLLGLGSKSTTKHLILVVWRWLQTRICAV